MRKKIVCILLFVFIFCGIIHFANDNSKDDTKHLESVFYCNLVNELAQSNKVYFETLIPVEWDIMKVFAPYTTSTDKITFVGYEYSKELQSLEYEDLMSLLFMKDGNVVYFIDALAPRMFKYHFRESTLNASLQNKLKYEENREVYDTISSWNVTGTWNYHAYVDLATVQDRPFIELRKMDNSYALIIDTER